MKRIIVAQSVAQEAQNIIDGVYAPLNGFVREKDFHSICDGLRLSDGFVWTMPILLDISEDSKNVLESGGALEITDESGAVFVVENIEIYNVDKKTAAKKLFGTSDENHPGVARFMGLGEYFIGGNVHVVDGKEFVSSDARYKTPNETKEIFRKNGWTHVVAFQTRNPPHRSHEFLQKRALAQVDGLLIQPVIGPKKEGDIKDEFIIGSYEILIEKYYKPETIELGTFHTFMRYAGPREAVFHAQVRRNFGCTHMIIGRDHAGVGDYYGTYDAQNIFDQFTEEELGITVFKYNNVSYCKECENMTPEGTCPHPDDAKVHLSGTELRRRLQEKEEIPDKFMRREVVEYLEERKDIFAGGNKY